MRHVRAIGRVAVVAAALLGASAMLPGVARAQGGEALPEVSDTLMTAGPARCDGEIVREIIIYSSAPTVARLHSLPVVGAIARSTHVTTRPDIVRGFLLLAEGDPCTELARAESERVLRAQPYLADADIAVERLADGVRLLVTTIDEASLVVGARVQSGTPFVRAFRFGNSNIGGAGVYMTGEWREGRALRDGGSIDLTDHQFLGQPYVLQLRAARAPLGGDWSAALTRPFFTGLQRTAWRAALGELVGYSGLQHPDSVGHAVRVERKYGEAGIIGRIGPPVRMGLLGVLLSHEREAVGSSLHVMRDEGAIAEVGPYPSPAPYRATRLNALVGLRNLSFVQVRGFDALTATQDIPVGIQAGFMVGGGLEPSTDDAGGREIFVAGDVYMGQGDSTQATRIQLRVQGMRTTADPMWRRSVVTGRFAHQRKPASQHLLELSADWAAGWRVATPLQLMLGAEDGGVRGYNDLRAGGIRRARVSLEDRYTVGNIRRFGDLGIAAFADAGRVWRGDSPFDVTTPVHASAGVSLLAAVPARSARMWRLDLAVPLNGPDGHRLEIGLTRGGRRAVFWREPGDVAALRGRAVPASVFAWP